LDSEWSSSLHLGFFALGQQDRADSRAGAQHAAQQRATRAPARYSAQHRSDRSPAADEYDLAVSFATGHATLLIDRPTVVLVGRGQGAGELHSRAVRENQIIKIDCYCTRFARSLCRGDRGYLPFHNRSGGYYGLSVHIHRNGDSSGEPVSNPR
jgi:hypothetical protein